jgi:hypothetical protein
MDSEIEFLGEKPFIAHLAMEERQLGSISSVAAFLVGSAFLCEGYYGVFVDRI